MQRLDLGEISVKTFIFDLLCFSFFGFLILKIQFIPMARSTSSRTNKENKKRKTHIEKEKRNNKERT